MNLNQYLKKGLTVLTLMLIISAPITVVAADELTINGNNSEVELNETARQDATNDVLSGLLEVNNNRLLEQNGDYLKAYREEFTRRLALYQQYYQDGQLAAQNNGTRMDTAEADSDDFLVTVFNQGFDEYLSQQTETLSEVPTQQPVVAKADTHQDIPVEPAPKIEPSKNLPRMDSHLPTQHSNKVGNGGAETAARKPDSKAQTLAKQVDEAIVTPKPASPATPQSRLKGPETASNQSTVTFKVTPNGDHQKFIDQIGPDAQKIAARSDLYASVMIAQAALESSWGTSDLGQHPNHNLFGVKGGFRGQSVQMWTKEDNGLGHQFRVLADFRSYPSFKESLLDYTTVMKQPLFAPVTKSQTQNYRQVTNYLTGRYATDTSYGNKLNQIIETYHLTKYDHAPQHAGSKNQNHDKNAKLNSVRHRLVKQKQKGSSHSQNMFQRFGHQIAFSSVGFGCCLIMRKLLKL